MCHTPFMFCSRIYLLQRIYLVSVPSDNSWSGRPSMWCIVGSSLQLLHARWDDVNGTLLLSDIQSNDSLLKIGASNFRDVLMPGIRISSKDHIVHLLQILAPRKRLLFSTINSVYLSRPSFFPALHPKNLSVASSFLCIKSVLEILFSA